jgi:oxygen-independent coproporphyrinogen-3 oxidase
VVPDGDLARALYDVTGELTAARGFAAYEVSNYARPGSESRHNLLYWRYGEYAGIGPGAHGRIIARGGRQATVTERNPEAWAALVETADSGVVEMTELRLSEQADEMLLMGLRLNEGIDLGRLASLGGARPHPVVINGLVQLGLLEVIAPACKPDADLASAHQGGDDDIRACAGPGLVPEVPAARFSADRIRATRSGRLVLNAVVAELSKSFAVANRMDNVADAL